jgi:hypothetical protein
VALKIPKYTNVFNSKAFNRRPELGFFGMQMYHLATLAEPSDTYYVDFLD